MSKMKAGCTTQPLVTQTDALGDEANDREVMRITRDIMVEYRGTLEVLAKSEAEDRK